MALSKSLLKRLAKTALAGVAAGMIAAPVFAECQSATPDLSAPASGGVITLPLTNARGQVQSVLDALSVSNLAVRFNNVTVTQGTPKGFRVFVNAKDAGPQTSIDDPSYVASVAFFPQPVLGTSAGSFVVDLSPTLDRMAKQDLLAADAPLSLTVVPIGPADARISVGPPEILQ